MYPATMLVCASDIEGSSSSSSAGGPLAASHARSFQPLRRWTTVTTSRGGLGATVEALDGGAGRPGKPGGTGAAGLAWTAPGVDSARTARRTLVCAGRTAGVAAGPRGSGAAGAGAVEAAGAAGAVCRAEAAVGRHRQTSRREPPKRRPRVAP